MYSFIKYLFFFLLIITACKKDNAIEIKNPHGHITLQFKHLVDNNPIEKDVMKYVNAAGNHYQINKLMYFISEISLYTKGAKAIEITENNGAHLIDIDMSESMQWTITDEISIGKFDSISFVFGIRSEKNKTGLFVNPPESNMLWPEVLGGGYHYLMMNGKWLDTANVLNNFSFHLGKGQLYKNNSMSVDSIYAFVDNSFMVTLPATFTILPDKQKTIALVMNIESWFKTPFVYNINKWGAGIMHNQNAMHTACENGKDVFTIETIQ